MRSWLAMAALPLLACGNPQAGASFRGAPVYAVPANMSAGIPSVVGMPNVRAALFFSTEPASMDTSTWKELEASDTVVAVPSDNTLNVFANPGAELMTTEDGQSLGYALGWVTAYQDTNMNGQHDPGEPILGVESDVAYLYAPATLPMGQAPTRLPLEAGWTAVITPQPCGDAPPAPTSPGDCGVPLGSSCSSDMDCNGGMCLLQTELFWATGYCTVADPPANGCRPDAGVYMHVPMYAPNPPGVSGYWLRACKQDADCDHSLNMAMYVCDPGLGACVPRSVGVVPVGGMSFVEEFCAGDITAPPAMGMASSLEGDGGSTRLPDGGMPPP